MATLVELVERFSSKTTTLKQCMDLRHSAQSSVCVNDLRAIDREVAEIEDILEQLRTTLHEEKQNLNKGKELLQIAQQYKDGLSHITTNLPSHLPGLKRESKRSRQPSDQPTSENVKPVKIAKTNISNAEDNIPKLQYITVGDFDKVPQYVKGRINYKQVNEAVDEINKVFKAKYKILSLPRSAMGEHVMKKYKAFKEAETADTKGKFFIIDDDIKSYSSLKLDKAGRSMLTILRVTGRLKEHRTGGLIRYVLQC